MMQTLRDHMKHIIIITGVAFVATIIFSWGMGGFRGRGMEAERGIVGEVNGTKILYQQFAQSVNQELESLKQRTGEAEISEYQVNSVRDNVWQTMVRDILFQDQINRLGLSASIEEIRYYVTQNPPDFVRSNEQLQTDGKFDVAKYQQALNDPRNEETFTAPIIHYLATALPVQKLQQRVLATVRVTDDEVREYYRFKNNQVNAKYLLFESDKVSLENIVVSEDEMHRYYKEHSKDYGVAESRTIEYVLFENKPTYQDSMQTRQDMMDILSQLQAGQDFSELAKELSEDEGTAPQGGDLGFFGKGTMDKAFEDAAFSAKVGDVVGPVETAFGLHLIRVEGRKQEAGELKIQARHILLKIKPSNETWETMNRRAEDFVELFKNRKEKSLKPLAEEERLLCEETAPFQQGGFIPGIGFAARISHQTFNEKLGWVSQPVYSGDNLIVFRISGIQKAYTKSFDEMKAAIEKQLQREKQEVKAAEDAQAKRREMTISSDFELVAGKYGLLIEETGPFSLNSYVSKVGRDPDFVGNAYKLEVGQISQPFKGRRGYYILKTTAREFVSDDVVESVLAGEKERLIQMKMQSVYTAWYDELQDKSKIKDFRNQYF